MNKLPMETRVQILTMLVEGSSHNQTETLPSVAKWRRLGTPAVKRSDAKRACRSCTKSR